MRNYYVVLGISKGADLDRIKKAYRSVVKKYHPDVARTQESKERFLEIREAYDTLTDEARRRQYDVELERDHSSVRIRGVPEIIEIRRSWWNDMEDWFASPADEFFEGFLPGFFDRDRRRVHEKALFFEAILSPEEAAAGGHFPVTVPVLAPCPECGTSGLRGPFFCPTCRGYGRVHVEREFHLIIPPNVVHGTEMQIPLDDIGAKGVSLHVTVYIDPGVRSSF